MSNLTVYPLEDNYSSTLTQAWDWSTGAVNVATTPTFTFPSGVTTYIVVNPGKANMQIAEINAYDSSAKTLTVSNITLEKWASVNSTVQSHAVWSKIIISDNFDFWDSIATAINSKLDDDGDWNWAAATTFAWMIAKSLTEAQRDALTPSNWMIILNTTSWVLNQYIGWAWASFATWTTANASTTVAGKVEIATDAEVTAWTWTGWTGAVLSVTPTQANKLVNLATTDTTSSDTDFLIFEDAAASNINKKITQANFRDQIAASTTQKGTVELATDVEAAAWTDETRYINPKQLITYGGITTDTTLETRDTQAASWTVTYNHWLWKIPSLIMVDAAWASVQASKWTWITGDDNKSVYYPGGTWLSSTTYAIFLKESDADWQIWIINNVTSTTFDVVWTYTATPAAYTIQLLFTFFG